MENKIEENVLNNLNNAAENWHIKVKIAEELFDNINDIENSSFVIKPYVWHIYLITVSSYDIEKYIKYPSIYKLMNKYKHISEYHNLQFMFLKINEMWTQKKMEIYSKFKELYGDNLILDETEYYLMVWFFWWSQWRTNQEVIDNMQKLFDVKTLEI